MKQIRQSIVTVAGHVDHGKTTLLDSLRGTSLQDEEAGGITQKISFTLFPREQLEKSCPLIKTQKLKLDIPGFLFIDTPGHAAFTNLRRRGGNLADLAVLVIDINEGIKPQTAEVIQILKKNKVPFIIALNKIDKISGWKTQKEKSLNESIGLQAKNTKEIFDEKYMTLIGSLQAHGFDSDLFYNINDFTKKIALVPCSAKTLEGIPELLLVLCGLSQRYLENRLVLGKDAKGIILEIKKEQSTRMEAILYDGTLNRNDEIAIAGINGEIIISKIRVLEEILPLSVRFRQKEEAHAATGLRLQLIDSKGILPGMPFQIYRKNRKEIEKNFKEQILESIKTDKQGIIAKADSLGSLEALLSILRQENISVVYAGIGNINKADIARAKANLKLNEPDAIIVGFNVPVDSDAVEIKGKVKIITEDVIYKLIENLQAFREDKRKEIEKKRLLGLAPLVKIKILPQYVFRNTNPAIFGIRIEAGKISGGISLVNSKNETIGRIKNIQVENKSVPGASQGQELAISVPGVNFERKLKDEAFLYSDVSESQFRIFKKNKDLLSASELSVLQEIAVIKRKHKERWGV